MKTNIKNIFFGVVLVGYHICDGAAPQEDFKSLQERSPFGDTPKPEPKPQKQASAPPPALPPAPKKPEMKLGFTGFLRMGGKDYYAICDKTSKDVIHTVLEGGTPSPLGYSAGRFDLGRRILDVRFNGFEYPCVMGADEKKSTVSSSSSKQSSGTSGGYGGDYNWDDWGDWNDDDWGDWDDWMDWDDGGYGYDDYGGGYGYDGYGGGYDDYYGYDDYGGW